MFCVTFYFANETQTLKFLFNFEDSLPTFLNCLSCAINENCFSHEEKTTGFEMEMKTEYTKQQYIWVVRDSKLYVIASYYLLAIYQSFVQSYDSVGLMDQLHEHSKKSSFHPSFLISHKIESV